MRANRRVDTKPELALRSHLHMLGLRFRKDFRVRVGTVTARPDIVFTRRCVAVFVDGCFWHGCPEHRQAPRANAAYWELKVLTNRARDERTDAGLAEAGWTVIRVWEHEGLEVATRRIVAAVRTVAAGS
jgi:DNA mismatch endonuclease (patch repair protein)